MLLLGTVFRRRMPPSCPEKSMAASVVAAKKRPNRVPFFWRLPTNPPTESEISMSLRAMRCRCTPTLTLAGLLAALWIGTAQAAESEQPMEYETGFYYTVQPGDTLWDLSQKFSDTPWQWPEMWQENDKIANPHRIYPGDVIRLHRRKGVATRVSEDLIEKIHFNYAPIERVGFIRKNPVVPHGTLHGVRAERELIADGDIVYLTPAADRTLTPGQRYTSFRILPPIKDTVSGEYIGRQHLLTGVLEIIQTEPDYAIAKVVNTYRPIEVGDGIMPYYRRLPRIDLQPSEAGIDGDIILSEEHKTIFGETEVVFINKGKADGVKPGQLYSIYLRDRHKLAEKGDGQKSKPVLVTPVDYGELLILHTEDTTATALITDSAKEFGSGSRVRTPLE